MGGGGGGGIAGAGGIGGAGGIAGAGGSAGQGGAAAQGGNGGAGGNGEFPPMPPLGMQLDRAGRAGVNTLIHALFSDAATRNAAQNAYNQNSAPTTWQSSHSADIAASLALLDALDENCGNQLLSCDDGNATCYDSMAAVLADDRLHINAMGSFCTTYFAVEANATGALPNQDCGGRKPSYDVIERTLSVFSGVGLAGFDDTIAPPPRSTGGNVSLFADSVAERCATTPNRSRRLSDT